MNCCHCRDRQHATGSAFALNALIEWHRIELIASCDPEEGDRQRAAASGRWVACDACGTDLWGYIPMYGAAVRFLRVGTLDQGEAMEPGAHFFVRSKHPWITIPPGSRQFDALPGPDDPPLYPPAARSRLTAALAAETPPG